MRSSFLALLSPWSLLASAHFTLDYPAARGFDEDKLGTFPCSGFDTVKDRTDWPLGGSGGEVSLTMGHDQALVQVLLGIGNDVGEAFNYVLLPTVQEQGLGKFCLSGLQLPKGLNVTDGTNATIQVVTNGDPNGGLYNASSLFLLLIFLPSPPLPSPPLPPPFPLLPLHRRGGETKIN
jgi:hypothetical protein